MSSCSAEPRWITHAMAIAIHADQVRQHGGIRGVRDEGLLDSALARARNHFEYAGEVDRLLLAAHFATGIARNHPFLDGNKRVAFQVMYVFLGLNGLRIDASEPEVVTLMLGVAEGTMDERAVAAWLKDRTMAR